MSPYAEAILLQVGINVLLALGYWIAVSTGKYSFGHAAFMAIGAYAASILTLNFDWPLPLAMLVAAVVAAVAGAAIGWMALRLSMLYLAIITFIFGQLVDAAVRAVGLRRRRQRHDRHERHHAPLVPSRSRWSSSYLVLLTRSRLGLAHAAIREDEQRRHGLRPADHPDRRRCVRHVGRRHRRRRGALAPTS